MTTETPRCRIGSATPTPCPRPATVRTDGNTEPDTCAFHAYLRLRHHVDDDITAALGRLHEIMEDVLSSPAPVSLPDWTPVDPEWVQTLKDAVVQFDTATADRREQGSPKIAARIEEVIGRLEDELELLTGDLIPRPAPRGR